MTRLRRMKGSNTPTTAAAVPYSSDEPARYLGVSYACLTQPWHCVCKGFHLRIGTKENECVDGVDDI